MRPCPGPSFRGVLGLAGPSLLLACLVLAPGCGLRSPEGSSGQIAAIEHGDADGGHLTDTTGDVAAGADVPAGKDGDGGGDAAGSGDAVGSGDGGGGGDTSSDGAVPPDGSASGRAVCDPCTATSQCQAGLVCAGIGKPAGSGGSFCTAPCSASPSPCADGYTCAATTTTEGGAVSACLPSAETCKCSAAALAGGWTTPCSKTASDKDGKPLGTCSGVWSCSASGATCSAAVPAAETCDGKDDDCDGLTDEGDTVCDDGNACTSGEACVGGVCQAGKNTCECQADGDCPQPKDKCQPKLGCQANQCVPVGSGVTCDGSKDTACAANQCDPATGACKLVATGGSSTACDADGSACTAGDHCLDGKCVPGKALGCDDGNPCTSDSCDGKVGCVHSPQAGPCDADGDACTQGDACKDGKCAPGAAKVCDDGNPCTADSCAKASGACLFSPAAGACDDGDACTTGDQCQGGDCQANGQLPCSDGNPCTVDGCSPTSGCTHAPASGPCDDGNACTEGDACANSACKPGAMTCQCQVDADCKGDPCLGKLVCDKSGAKPACTLVPGSAVVCGPGTPCSPDACNPATGQCGPKPAADGKPCDDGNACTQGDACQAGACKGGAAVVCNDGKVCTLDSCDKVKGCVNTNASGPCDADGNACTTTDLCEAGLCKAGAAKVCNDGNPCTTDGCDPKTGACTASGQALEGQNCGNACAPAQCQAGACKPLVPPNCDDGKPCTTDGCDPKLGCVHSNASGPCDDGNPCTVGDTCASGACQSGGPKPCDDGNPCTVDGCKAGSCVADPVPMQGKTCTPPAGCTGVATCTSGQCTIAGQTCDDGNVCTSDACDMTKGCLHTPNANPCNDNNACTSGDVCGGGACVPGKAKVCSDDSTCTLDKCDAKSGQCSYSAIAGCGTRFQRVYGGPGLDKFYAAIQTPDGGYVGVGGTESYGAGLRDVLVVKTDACGNPQWAKAYGGSKEEQAFGVANTLDGGLIVAAKSETTPGTYVLRLDKLGNVVWSGVYGGGGYDFPRSVTALKDGSFIVVVEQYTYSGQPSEKHAANFLKLDKDGKVVWVHSYGGTIEGDSMTRVFEQPDGSLIACGSNESDGYGVGDDDYWLMGLDSQGIQQWSYLYGADSDDELYDCMQTSDGGFLITGKTNGWDTIYHEKDAALLKIGPAPDFKIQWMRRFGGFDMDEGYRPVETPDGYGVIGRTSSWGVSKDMGKWDDMDDTNPNPYVQYDMFLAKTDKAGNLTSFTIYGNAYTQYGFDGARTMDGGFLLAGQAFGWGAGGSEGMLVKVDELGDAGSCNQTQISLDKVDTKACTPKKKTVFVKEYGGGFQLKMTTKVTEVPLTEKLATQVCPCK